jgi:CHAD domain-containing protein
MRAVSLILVRQLDEAIAGLKRCGHSAHAVHGVRKELKRVRATLRLLRTCFGVHAYHSENALIRDAAKPLTPARDAKVLLETLRRLEPETGVKEHNTFVRQLYRTLRHERQDAQRQVRAKDLAAAAAVLRAVERRVQGDSESRLDPAALGMGLKRTYQSGRKAFARVRKRPTDERLHEWRKQVSYLSHQLEIVLPLGHKRFASSHKRSHRLAQCLGEDHDLALLNDKILQYAKGPNAASQNDAVEALLDRLARQRRALQGKAYRLGRRLYSIRPRFIRAKIDKGLRHTKSQLAAQDV